MSRYAAARDGEDLCRPGWRGHFHTECVPVETAAAANDPEALRRSIVECAKASALRGYNDARARSLTESSWSWMKPPGRPRFRWVRRTRDLPGGPREVLELTCVVYPEQAIR